MIKKRYIVFYAIPMITIIAIIGIGLSGIDSGGDLPGVLRLLVFLASVALWSLLFSVTMLISMIRQRCWRFLALVVVLFAVRVVFFCEIVWINSENHLYLWLPIEYMLFYLLKYQDAKQEKITFTVITTVLYGICCYLCAPMLVWL